MYDYVLTRHRSDIIRILQDVEDKKHYSINMHFLEIFDNNTNLGNQILKNPEQALNELDKCIVQAQQVLLEEIQKSSNGNVKLNINARVYGLPPCPELQRHIFPKNDDLDLFLQITGTVIRVTSTKILEYQRIYFCKKCKFKDMIKASYDQSYIIIPPKRCTNPENCPGKEMICVSDLDANNCKDYQEIRIQEQPSKLEAGSMPSTMCVTLEDDLVDTCKPGDDVTICGIIKRRWSPLGSAKKIEAELVLKGNHVAINNDELSLTVITPDIKEQFINFWEQHSHHPLQGRDLILRSFCSKLSGMYTVKLAMAVVLAGGSNSKTGNEIGIQKRAEPHILLVGDPGTGKSQLLRYAAKVIPRSVLTTGIGTTSAGLTVAAVKEDGQWQLEGGALILADGGICCIDEFNSMKSNDRVSIHEAMEQQTISVAKASMVCKLRTRCSILAATNPKGGHLDNNQPLSLNLTLPSPLLSRFDLVLILSDTFDKDWDVLLTDHILNDVDDTTNMDKSHWNLEKLQQYFAIIKGIDPVLTPITNKILCNYYQAQRRTEFRNKARTTVRLLDSLVRLSQAHARLMFRNEVKVMDALFAVFLIENSMNGECAVLSENSVNVQAPFPNNTMEYYMKFAISVLQKLGLEDILNEELNLIRNNFNNTPSDSVNESTTHVVNSLVNQSAKPNNTVNISFGDILSNSQGNNSNNNKEKKRRNQTSPLNSTASKCMKKSEAPSAHKMFSMIPSVNDDFDENILNFPCTDNDQLPEAFNSNKTQELSQNSKVRKYIHDEFSFHPKAQPLLSTCHDDARKDKSILNNSNKNTQNGSNNHENIYLHPSSSIFENVIVNVNPSKTFNESALLYEDVEKSTNKPQVLKPIKRFKFRPQHQEGHEPNKKEEHVKNDENILNGNQPHIIEAPISTLPNVVNNVKKSISIQKNLDKFRFKSKAVDEITLGLNSNDKQHDTEKLETTNSNESIASIQSQTLFKDTEDDLSCLDLDF